MLREGPIPRFVHGAIEYLAAALLIAAPFLFSFTDVGAATAASIVVGVIVLFLAATHPGTDEPDRQRAGRRARRLRLRRWPSC